jgi:hypothetical protein
VCYSEHNFFDVRKITHMHEENLSRIVEKNSRSIGALRRSAAISLALSNLVAVNTRLP